MTAHASYFKKTEAIEIYHKLVHYWSMMFDTKLKAKPLDHMNFDVNVYPYAISLNEIEQLFEGLEPGYASDEGAEVIPIVRNLELSRLNYTNPKKKIQNTRLVENAGVGVGHGCTSVINGVLNSILRLQKETFQRQNRNPEIILVPLPSCEPLPALVGR